MLQEIHLMQVWRLGYGEDKCIPGLGLKDMQNGGGQTGIFRFEMPSHVLIKHHQSYEMSNCLHRSNLSNQILPEEKCVNRDKFNANIE